MGYGEVEVMEVSNNIKNVESFLNVFIRMNNSICFNKISALNAPKLIVFSVFYSLVHVYFGYVLNFVCMCSFLAAQAAQ